MSSAGILGSVFGDGGGQQQGILGPAPSSNPLALIGAALSDVSAHLAGKPQDATNIMTYQRQNAARQLMGAISSQDPATRAQAYSTALAMGIDPAPFRQAAAANAMPQLLSAMKPQQQVAPVTVTPPVAPAPDSGIVAQPGATPITDPSRMAAAQSGIAAPSLSDALSKVNSPELSAQMLLQIIQDKEAQQRVQTRPATQDEMIAHGYKPTDPGTINVWSGEFSSPVKPQAAVQQEFDIAANAPRTKEDIAKDAIAKEQADASLASATKPISVGMGDTLYNPSKGTFSAPPSAFGGGGAPASPGAPPVSGPAFLQTLNPTTAGVVKAIGDGKMSLTGFARNPAMGMQLRGMVMQYNPAYDETTMPTRLAARKDFINGADGKALTSISTSVDHLGTLGQLAGALGNGNLPLVNSLAQSYSQQTGKAAPTNFDAAKQVVGDEIVKALVGTGGSQSDREAAAATISRASSPQQLAGAIQTYQNLLAGKLGPLRQKYQANTKLQDFNDMLTPTTQQVLGSLPQGGVGPKASPAPSPANLPRLPPATTGWSNFRAH